VGYYKMRDDDTLLFSEYDLRSVIQTQQKKMFDEIDGIEENRLLNASIEDLCDYLEQKYKIGVPQLKEDGITVSQRETKIDISRDPERNFVFRHVGGSPYAGGTAVSCYIPFDGDSDLFKCRPSSFSLSGTHAIIQQNELILTYTQIEHNETAIKAAYERDIANIRQTLTTIANDVAGFNSGLRSNGRGWIEKRKQRLLKNQNLAESLGFPLRRRPDASSTYIAPTVRRKLPISRPPSSNAPFTPEPELEMQEYEFILSVISNMVQVMERSPHAFKGMKEEDLRHQFLVPLNGYYEGQATGETFNFEGKTDILIRVNGKNIFIAECKFWDGPEYLLKALNQLLGYATWRDTKTALLIFNRNKDFSSVLAKIPEVVKGHPNFKREISYTSESGFRYILHNRDDKNREIILTVLCFNIPQ
jgi:hypothetical protein